MKPSKKPTTPNPRLSRKLNEILFEHRNARGELSPALEAGLALFNAPPKSRKLTITDGRISHEAILFSSKKLLILWTPEATLVPFYSQLVLLGVDWAFCWNTGVEIAAAFRAADEMEREKERLAPSANNDRPRKRRELD